MMAINKAYDTSTWTPEAVEQALQALGVPPDQLGQRSPQPKVWNNSWSKGGKSQVVPPRQLHEWQRRQDDITRRQVEIQAKRAEEVEMREQHRAALVVRKVIQKMKLATPDTIDELRIELDMVRAQQFMAMGMLATKVQEEAEKAILDAQVKVAEEAERQIEEERRQLEEEMQRREEEARAEAIGEEAASDVAEVESKVNQAEELAMPLAVEATDESAEGLFEAAIVTEEAIASAQTDINLCSAAMKEKWSGISKRPGASGQQSMLQKLGPQYRSLHARLTACRRKLTKLLETTKATKDKVGRKAATLKQEREHKEAFERADADGDGSLSRQEVFAYVLRVFDMELDEAQINNIFLKVPGNDSGVTFGKLTQLHRIVGLMRSEIKDRAKKKEEASRRAEFEEAVAAHMAAMSAISDIVSEAGKAADDVRKILGPLSSQRKTEDLDTSQISSSLTRADAAMSPAWDKLQEAKTKLADVETEMRADLPKGTQERLVEETLRFKNAECGKLQKRVSVLQDRLVKLSAEAESVRISSERQSYADLQHFRMKVVAAIRARMADEGFTLVEIFSQMCGDSENLSEPERFAEFVRSLQNVSFESSSTDMLFEHMAEGSASISLAKFSEFMKLLYKVTKATNLSEGVPTSSKVVRRLVIGETLEAIEGPHRDERVGVLRMKCISASQNDQGWVTLSGNQGTLFLQPCPMFYYCVREVDLTENLSRRGGAVVRTVATNEIVEVFGNEEFDDSSNSSRTRCKAKLDGSCGWITISERGVKFLEPC